MRPVRATVSAATRDLLLHVPQAAEAAAVAPLPDAADLPSPLDTGRPIRADAHRLLWVRQRDRQLTLLDEPASDFPVCRAYASWWSIAGTLFTVSRVGDAADALHPA